MYHPGIAVQRNCHPERTGSWGPRREQGEVVSGVGRRSVLGVGRAAGREQCRGLPALL